MARAVVNEWFDKRMGLATGLASAGSGVGQLVMAPLLVTAMDSLGLSPTFLILGSVTGAGIILGLTLDVPEKTVNLKEVYNFGSNRMSLMSHNVCLSVYPAQSV